MDGSYAERHGRKPEITTEMLVELVLRKLRDFERNDYFFEAFNRYEDPYNQCHEARLPNPEQYVISELGRPGLWETLGHLEEIVENRDFPTWDEDTLFDVIELFHDRVVSSPVTDADGTFEGYSQESGREEFRSAINEILAKRSPSAELDEQGHIRAPAPPEAGQARTGADLEDGRGYDLFISHASEDKDAIARPLADALRARGHDVFFDEYELNVGDSLRRELDRGLREARRGVVILSKAFFAKEWPQRELDAMIAREASSRGSLIIPVWHEVSADEVQRYSPTLADRLAIDSSRGLEAVVTAIERALERSGGAVTPTEPTAVVQASSSRGHSTPPQLRAGMPGRARRRIPGVAWFRKDEKITIGEWIVIGALAAIVAGAILALPVGGGEDSSKGSGEEPIAWSAPVQAAVTRSDGAAVRDRVDLASGSVVDRVLPEEELEFGGYCLGAETSDVLTATPDILWYRLRGTEHYIASGVVDGFPPDDLQPERCLGDSAGPRVLTASHHEGRISAKAPDAPLVGFAFLERNASTWRALPLDFKSGDGFDTKVPRAGPGVVLAAVCWAVAAPAHPHAPYRYLTDRVRVGRPGERSIDRASAIVGQGAVAACGPDAYNEARG